jgi:peptidoglycan-N-acetylmuramic acid deacetylase
MKKTFKLLIICSLILLSIPLEVFAQGNSYSWYCKRNSEHKQPDVDAPLSFISDYGGYYVDKRASDNGDKVIYLTFDVGYENGNVARILDTLKEENTPAAFFVLKNVIEKEPSLIMRMINEGHLVCNHTANHPDVTKYATKEELLSELAKLEQVYYDLTGLEMPKYFRPPEGRFSERSMRFANDLGYKTIFWSFAYADWDNNAQMRPETAMKKIMDNVHNGEIMLLHPTSATNADILGDVIRALKAEGYRFGTLDELTSEYKT